MVLVRSIDFCCCFDQRTNGFVMMFRNDNNLCQYASAPHGGLWSLADLGTLSIAPGVEDFSLCLTLDAVRCPFVEVFSLWLTLGRCPIAPICGGL